MNQPNSRGVPVSVTTPVGQAWERMVKVCFLPWDLQKWLGLGFALFLAMLWSEFSRVIGQLTRWLPWDRMLPVAATGQGLHGYLQSHGMQWLTLGAAVVGVGLVLWAVCTWFSCRGQFMFYDGLIGNHGRIRQPWVEHADRGNRLFFFNLAITGAFWLITVLALGGGLWVVWPDLVAGFPGARTQWTLVVGVTLLTLNALLYLKAMMVTRDFIVPMMLARPVGPWRAWWIWLGDFLVHHVWAIILFYLMRMVFGMVIGSIGVFTCCLTCGFGALPYVGAVILLPAMAFDRLYTAYFVEQFGAIWRLFPDEADRPTCPSCRYDLRGNPDAARCPECGFDLVLYAEAMRMPRPGSDSGA